MEGLALIEFPASKMKLNFKEELNELKILEEVKI